VCPVGQHPFPSAQGRASTFTPQQSQSTRRMIYMKNTAMPHSGTNSKGRMGRVS
jgi:hypothetical protein